jgi:uncharacterized protein YyaL (SSP411 family)
MSFTPKQQKLIQIIIENYGNKGNTKSLGEMILEAGYSEATAINPKLIITEEMQEMIDPVVEKMETIRTKALDKITDEKLTLSSARDNAYVADTLTKNIQLLSGKETERTNLIIEDNDKITNAIRNITTGDNRGSDTKGE